MMLYIVSKAYNTVRFCTHGNFAADYHLKQELEPIYYCLLYATE